MKFKKFYPENYDLSKTITCGQLFRWYRLDDRKFKLISGFKSCVVQQDDPFGPVLLCTEDVDYWYDYLALDDEAFDYFYFYDIMKSSPALSKIYNYSAGIRILNQDPWEVLVGFIISQRNNIPRIMGCVEKISNKLGTPIDIDHNSFPTAQAIAPFTLQDCGLGYREPYIYAAASAVRNKEIVLEALTSKVGCTSERALQELERLYGVGYKVACCVALFGLGHRDIFPVDVWISRAIDNNVISYDAIKSLGKNSGLVQQYVYFYMINGQLGT